MAEPGIFEILYSTRAMRRLKPDPIPEATLNLYGMHSPKLASLWLIRWLMPRSLLRGSSRRLSTRGPGPPVAAMRRNGRFSSSAIRS
jgi:hypothetical protein